MGSDIRPVAQLVVDNSGMNTTTSSSSNPLAGGSGGGAQDPLQLATHTSSVSVGTPHGPGTMSFSSESAVGDTSSGGHSSTANHTSREEGGESSMDIPDDSTGKDSEQEKFPQRFFNSEEYARRLAMMEAITEENYERVEFAVPQERSRREGNSARPGDKRHRASSAGSSGAAANPRKRAPGGDNVITSYFPANNNQTTSASDDSVVVLQSGNQGASNSTQNSGNRGLVEEMRRDPNSQNAQNQPAKTQPLTKTQRKKRNKEMKEKIKPRPCVDANLDKVARKQLRARIQTLLWPESDPSLFRAFQEETGIVSKANVLNMVLQRPEFAPIWERFETRKNADELRETTKTLMVNLINWVPEEVEKSDSQGEQAATPAVPPETSSAESSSEATAAPATEGEPQPGPSGLQQRPAGGSDGARGGAGAPPPPPKAATPLAKAPPTGAAPVPLPKREFVKSEHFLAVYMIQGTHQWHTFNEDVWRQLVIEMDDLGYATLEANMEGNKKHLILPIALHMGWKNGHGFIIPDGQICRDYYQNLISKVCMQVKGHPGWTKFRAYTSSELEEQRGIKEVELRSQPGQGWRYEKKLDKCELVGVKTGPLGSLFQSGHIRIKKSQLTTGTSKSAGIFLKVDAFAFKKIQALGAIQIIHGTWEFWHAGARLNPAMGGGGAAAGAPATPPITPPLVQQPSQQQGQQTPAQQQAATPGQQQTEPQQSESAANPPQGAENEDSQMEEDLTGGDDADQPDVEFEEEQRLLQSP